MRFLLCIFLAWFLSCSLLSDAVAKRTFSPSTAGTRRSSNESIETVSRFKIFHFFNFDDSEKNSTNLEEDKRSAPTGPNPLHNRLERKLKLGRQEDRAGHRSIRLPLRSSPRYRSHLVIFLLPESTMRRSCLSSLLNRSDLSYLRDALCGHAFVQNAGYSTVGQNFARTGSSTDRIFAPYSVYKGKASLSLSPVLPTFMKVESGAGLRVDRRGSMMLRFCPAVGERKYDYEKRQLFALSATEIGSVISLGPTDSCEFFHDPSMKSSNAGQVRKSLSIKPTQDGSGYFISLSVVNNLLKTTERFTVPVTTAEFAVMKAACSFALPHIIGWDHYTSHHRPRIGEKAPNVDPGLLDLEWDR